jgi:alpha-beta hydrolase superfamily lysophospholipase
LAEPRSAVIATWRASDGYEAHVRRYLPEGEPRANIVCLHGIQSHGGWYDHSSRALCAAGYAVHYLDRRGSGLNQQARGDAPFFRRLLDDIREYIDQHALANNPTPLVLMGCSWGGKLVPAFCRRHPDVVDALVLLFPGIVPKVYPGLFERMRIFVARLFTPDKRFPIPLNDPRLFTASPDWQKFIAEDPLALHDATARFLFESFRIDLYLKLRRRAGIRQPILLMLAAKDRIINNAAVRKFLRKRARGHRWIIEYPEAQHTLEFEPDPDRHVKDLLAWLKCIEAELRWTKRR